MQLSDLKKSARYRTPLFGRTVFPKWELFAMKLSKMSAEMTKFVVKYHMVRVRNELKVLDAVIELVIVDVMNVFRVFKFAPKMPLHDYSMFKPLLSSNGYHSVSLANSSGTVPSFFSKVRIPIAFYSQVMRVTKTVREVLILAAFDFTLFHYP